MPRIERALLSVTNKTGILEFAANLHREGVELISTGGTAKLLRENRIPVREVAEITGFPEMLDGRVKTIHPRIAGGILAIRSNPEHMRAIAEHDIPAIQMVVVNLYEFEKFANKPGVTREELIENIDIGGPTMIRAAAKNFQDVAIVVSPDQYQAILDELRSHNGALSAPTHWKLAQEAFSHTAAYDAAVSSRLAQIDATGAPRKIANFPTPFACRQTGRQYCATAKILISAQRYTALRAAELLAPNSLTARNCLTTTWWIWTRLGNWHRSLPAPLAPSSNTPIPAGAQSR